MQKLAINSNNVVEVTGLTNIVTGEFVNDANVNLTVRELQTGEAIDGAVWPTDMTAVGSGGVYRVILDSFIVLNRNKEYILDVTAATPTESTNWQTVVPAEVLT